MTDNNPAQEPTLRDTHNYSDIAGRKFLRETSKLQEKVQTYAPQFLKDEHEKKDKQPSGGYDSTPVPSAPPGYTVQITFHRAHNLPFADFTSLSSDPYLIASLKTALPKRHKQDPDLSFRTPTIRRDTNPSWNSVWVIAHIPPSGFNMKVRLYDEDPADHDDRLGNAHIQVDTISEQWTGLNERSYEIKKRMASKRAYLIRGCAALISRDVKMSGELIVSVECLGRSEGDGGRAYTLRPLPWTRHYSPLIGRLTGTKDRSETDDGGKKKPGKYNFQAIQMQLPGPVPPELYHRYVEFRPFVTGLFTSRSLQGRILNRALHHQHRRIYNYDRSTLYGYFQESSIDLTKQFLDFVHYDNGGRIFTFVLTLDAQWRFTETGKEFGIDLLSKHSMHSDVSIYIAWSGEFFIRRLKKPWRPGKEDDNDPESDTVPAEAESDEEDDPESDKQDTKSREPEYYELIIDNDSGTYRPNAKLLPTFRDYMRRALPGLKVVTLDCLSDAEKMKKLKQEQRDRKMKTKGRVQYMQRSSTSSSISSSDESDLDELERKNRAEDEKHRKTAKVAQGGKLATAAVKTVIDGAAESAHCSKEGDENCKDNCGGRGMGGIVGENGPVKMRERKEKFKAERKKLLHSKKHGSDVVDGLPVEEDKKQKPESMDRDTTSNEKPAREKTTHDETNKADTKKVV